MRDVFFSFDEFFVDAFFRHRYGQQILLRKIGTSFSFEVPKRVELEYRPCFLPFVL